MNVAQRTRADSSLERGLVILEEIATSSNHTASSLSAAIGLPVSTTYRYLRTLRERGFVREDQGHYAPGAVLIQLTGSHFAHSQLAELGPAALHAIVDLVGETCVMIVRAGTRALSLCQAEPNKPLRYTYRVNELLPLHAGAGPRVLLSWAPLAVIERVLAAGDDLVRYSANTLTAAQVRQSIPIIRQTGWAVSRGEYFDGSVSVAVPVLFGGEVVCSLNVAGPASRCGSAAWVQRVIKILREASVEITEVLESWALNDLLTVSAHTAAIHHNSMRDRK